mgnify:CR=1 FL=1
MVNLSRLFRHFLTPDWVANRAFPPAARHSISAAIAQSETLHSGEIRFVAEAALASCPLLNNQSARDRALEVFSELRIWDTEDNNGVLIYVLLADHNVEIIADRGLARRVEQQIWERICQDMERRFARVEFEAGALLGIKQVGQLLVQYFPITDVNKNELDDRPVIR